MTRVTIEFEGLLSSVDVADPWEVLRYAAKRPSSSKRIDEEGRLTQRSQLGADRHETGEKRPSSSSPPKEEGRLTQRSQSQAARIREIAAELLADGEFHPRREITAAVRAAGLTAKNVDNALKSERFEKTTNLEGRPAFRDHEAPRPERHPRKPDWARHMEALEPADGRIEVVGILGRNGGGPEEDGSDG